MKNEFVAVAVTFGLISAVANAKPKCDLPEWRDLPHEASVLKTHAGVAQRDGGRLKISLQSGKTADFEDKHEGEEPGGPYEIHRVIDVGPKQEWVTLFEPGSDSFGYRIIHRKSGKVEELAGCPVWSKDGHYFVALHEDLESGRTPNEASLWYCENPAESCVKIWNAPEGGRDARWTGTRARITLSKIDMNQKGQPEVVKTVQCSPKREKANCRASK